MRISTLCLLMTISSVAMAEPQHRMAPILSDSPAKNSQRNSGPGEPGEGAPIVLEVVLHDKASILNMLRRAEALAMTPNPAARSRQIALVLHGPEIEHFRISKYKGNQDIVDLAAKLDAFNVIDIKMCNTMMNQLSVDKQEIPAFIEIVPYGPGEVEELLGKGFIKL